MTLDGQRSVRLFFKLGLLVSLPVAGYLWAQTGLSQWTIGLGAICVIMALGAEGLASAAESRLTQLKAMDEAEERQYQAAIAVTDEKARQMDRVVETLSNQNHDLRGKLVSLHGELHNVQEETAHLNLDGAEEGNAEPAAGQGGEVTDITSILKR